jgi:hypothetical protein
MDILTFEKSFHQQDKQSEKRCMSSSFIAKFVLKKGNRSHLQSDSDDHHRSDRVGCS